MENDRTYLIRRASEERSAAMKAANIKARQAHLQLARRYEERAQPD
ncbi:MAG: hypothetical protein ABI454_13090 [Sphingomicrobium sp.]